VPNLPRTPSDPTRNRIPPEFTDRYRDIRAQVRIFLRHEYRSLVDIDEIADAVLEKLLIHWHTVDEPVRWAISVAKHRAVDELRKAPVAELEESMSADSIWMSRLGVVEHQFNVHVIVEALHTLPDRERRALILAALGFTNQEIADITQSAANSVSHYLCEGRKKLEQILPYRRRKSRRTRRSGNP
jgi:RNA polymerase sigma factor (sigma-70 family)